jgi:hypothetical protein
MILSAAVRTLLPVTTSDTLSCLRNGDQLVCDLARPRGRIAGLSAARDTTP